MYLDFRQTIFAKLRIYKSVALTKIGRFIHNATTAPSLVFKKINKSRATSATFLLYPRVVNPLTREYGLSSNAIPFVFILILESVPIFSHLKVHLKTLTMPLSIPFTDRFEIFNPLTTETRRIFSTETGLVSVGRRVLYLSLHVFGPPKTSRTK